MSIVKMKRLRIFGMASDCEELLRKLQHLGCVELRAPTQPSSDPGWQGFTAKSDGELAKVASPPGPELRSGNCLTDR